MTEEESALGTAVVVLGCWYLTAMQVDCITLEELSVGILNSYHIFKTLPVTQTVTNNITTHE